MKRKQFFTTVAAASLGSFGGYGLGSSRASGISLPRDSGKIGTIAGKSLEEIRDIYRRDLFEDFLPAMENHVIDHEYGGFICNLDIRTGERLSTGKRAWFEGRGMWVYSFLYNHIEQDPSFLEVARKSKDFILEHEPADNSFWRASYTREGEPSSEGPGDIYCNLFIAEGLSEYAKASGESEYFDRAKSILLDCLSRYDQPDYQHREQTPGIRLLGHWMVFLIASSQMLRQQEDPEIRQVADRSVEAIMNRHLNPEYNLLNEYMTHDMNRPADNYEQYSYTGHAIETLWMVMFEAARRQDRDLFREAADAFKRHVTVAQDAVYGGYFRSLDHVDNHTWKVDKVLWLQEEVQIGTMLMIEHMNDPWAKKIFAENDAYIREKFVLPGYKFWPVSGDRIVEDHNTTRAGNYHHPRHLMLNLLAIERLIDREGQA
ncbi:MAG: hypothetical protein WD317_02670 [Balneolaceae bacterium]